VIVPKKDPTAVAIGKRIRQSRKMAGFNTAADLNQKFPAWSSSRLGNYESGQSMPSPDIVMDIAKETDTSPCWIMFGLGPIRSAQRDLQAVRHQNLLYLLKDTSSKEKRQLAKPLNLTTIQLEQHLGNPFKKIPDRLARKLERQFGKEKGWLDEQHVVSDGISSAFPDDMRELMEIYSEMPAEKRSALLEIARSVFKIVPEWITGPIHKPQQIFATGLPLFLHLLALILKLTMAISNGEESHGEEGCEVGGRIG
jgi:transcriptional regulator with XRE-family HTH domain